MDSQRELQLLVDGGFDVVGYWATREVKVWVVEVTRGRGPDRKQQTMYVRSRTRDGAESTARDNTFITGTVEARARLATPRDLGCVPTPQAK